MNLKGRRWVSRLAFFLILLPSVMFLSPSGLSAKSPGVDSPTGDWLNDLRNCVKTELQLGVLFLIDESKSLIKNRLNENGIGSDPEGGRVEGVIAAISALQSLANEVDADGKKVDVYVAIDGFGRGYHPRGSSNGFTALNDETLGDLTSQAEAFRSLTNDENTDYRAALDGANAAFNGFRDQIGSQIEESCQLVVWFTDGEYDTGDDPDLNPSEKSQIKNGICGDGGKADALRASNVKIYAIGLGKKDKKGNPPDFGLMNRISEGIGEPCGNVPAAGTFKSIENLDLLPDVFLQPPLWDGGPSQPSKPCGTGEPNCAEIKFDMPEWINHFQILIKSPNRDLSVEVKDPTGQVTPIPIGVNMEDSNKKVDIAAGVTMQRLSRTRAMLVGDQIGRGGAGWAGEWVVIFRGEGAGEGAAQLKFIGALGISVDQKELDRKELKGLEIRVESEKNTPFESRFANYDDLLADVTLKVSGKELPLKGKTVDSKGVILIDTAELESFLGDGLGKTAASLIIEVQPRGIIEFAEERTQIDMPVVSTRIKLRTGKGFPRIDGILSVSKLDGTKSGTVVINVVGPEEGEGRITIGESENDEADVVEVVSEITTCTVKANETKTCEIKFEASKTANAFIELPLKFELSGTKVDGNEKLTDQLPVRIEMTRPLNSEDFWKRLVLLLLLFAIVQGSVRFLLVFVKAKFRGVRPNSRFITFRVNIDADGNLNAEGGQFTGQYDQLRFAQDLEADFRSKSFFVDNRNTLQFEISLFKALFKYPLFGLVTSQGPTVGQKGVERTKAGLLAARVPLMLRKGWIIALDEGASNDSLKRMGKLEGTLLILLDPVPETDLQDQIDEVLTAVEGSGQLKVLIDLLVSQVESEIDQPVDKPVVAAKGDDWFSTTTYSPDDDLGGSDIKNLDPVVVETADGEAKRPKREKKFKQPKEKRVKKNTEETQESISPDSDGSSSAFD
jgi:hypothetical protein